MTGAGDRRFVLTLNPSTGGDGWGFSVAETINGCLRVSETVLSAHHGRAARLRRIVLEAVTASGYPAHAVGPQRRRPFNLAQDPGVRLVLTARALAPVRNPSRRDEIAAGIAAMTPEEALYWHALTSDHNASRGLQALRVLLAGARRGVRAAWEPARRLAAA